MAQRERELRVVSEVRIAEFLEPQQGILYQPPFNWIREDERIFPDDLFFDDLGYPYFMRIWFVYDLNNAAYYRSRRENLYAKALKLISVEYRDDDLLSYLRLKITEAVEKYPYALEYLCEYWSLKNYFSDSGDRSLGRSKHLRILSYAAYADVSLKLERGAKLAGLDDELPEASVALDIVEAMPAGKPDTNKYFRLVSYSEALK